MRAYFLRHATAVDGADDAARELSKLGWQQAKAMGRFLRDAGVAFDGAFTSPLVRARQTAEAVMEFCGTGESPTAVEAEELLFGVPAQHFQGWLQSLSEHKRLLLVGHAPSLADRARELLSINRPDALLIPKGGLVCIKLSVGAFGQLKFMMTPKMLGMS